jgi:hypothetical protein
MRTDGLIFRIYGMRRIFHKVERKRFELFCGFGYKENRLWRFDI